MYPRKYVVACCARCETPLCIDGPPTNECAGCGKSPPEPMAKVLTLQSGQMYQVQRVDPNKPPEIEQSGAENESSDVQES
eukprot:2725107-Karenia_brevis.AAC.1